MPDLFSMIRKVSWMIMDNGGASGDILDSIVRNGNRYLTRVRMNISDDERIGNEADRWEYVEDGVCCLRHTFGSSGRTTYLFFTVDNMIRSYNTAERQVDRMIDAIRTFEKIQARSLGAIDTSRSFEQVSRKVYGGTSNTFIEKDNGTETDEGMEGIVHTRIDDTGIAIGDSDGYGKYEFGKDRMETGGNGDCH